MGGTLAWRQLCTMGQFGQIDHRYGRVTIFIIILLSFLLSIHFSWHLFICLISASQKNALAYCLMTNSPTIKYWARKQDLRFCIETNDFQLVCFEKIISSLSVSVSWFERAGDGKNNKLRIDMSRNSRF